MINANITLLTVRKRCTRAENACLLRLSNLSVYYRRITFPFFMISCKSERAVHGLQWNNPVTVLDLYFDWSPGAMSLWLNLLLSSTVCLYGSSTVLVSNNRLCLESRV